MVLKLLDNSEKKLLRNYKVFVFIIIILLPIFIFTSSFNFAFFNEIKNYEELDNFFNGGEDLDSFSEKEVIHLEEVRVLVSNSAGAMLVSLMLLICSLFILSYGSKQDIGKAIIYGSFLTLVLSLILFIFTLVNFDVLFLNFHKIFFRGDNWLLDENSLLIQMFPFSFFLNIAKKIFLVIFLESAVLLGVGFWLKKKFG